jgi:hypothetical protein
MIAMRPPQSVVVNSTATKRSGSHRANGEFMGEFTNRR